MIAPQIFTVAPVNLVFLDRLLQAQHSAGTEVQRARSIRLRPARSNPTSAGALSAGGQPLPACIHT